MGFFGSPKPPDVVATPPPDPNAVNVQIDKQTELKTNSLARYLARMSMSGANELRGDQPQNTGLRY